MARLMGVLLIVLGALVLVTPLLAGIISIIVIGSFMAIAGVAECARAFKETSAFSRMVWVLVGIVTLICGLLVAVHPIFGLSFLTLLLAVYFFAEGIVKIGAAFKYVDSRGWFITSGILSLLLSYLIWSNWPLSGGWAIGVLVGVNFIFTGIMALAVGEALS